MPASVCKRGREKRRRKTDGSNCCKSAGFCFGVKRAVDTVYREIESGEKPVYTFGPIIHNEQVVEDLENRGVQVIHSEDELEGFPAEPL